MNKNTFHIEANQAEAVNCFPEIEMHFSVSKEMVWEQLSAQIDAPSIGHKSYTVGRYLRLAAAASILLCISLGGFLRLYTQTIYSPAGQHLTFNLPDNSTIQLNAESTIKFHPYWYKLSRTVFLDGEAFFKVNKGNKFAVESKMGITTVLGTSFNIYSRGNDYSVTCFTGKVSVTSNEKRENILLSPDEQAFITKDGYLRFVPKVNNQNVRSWIDNMFTFTGVSVGYVIKEIERQYNIKITFNGDASLTYTGYFSKSFSEKEVLDLVCTSLGLKFESRSETEFLIN